MCGYSDSNTIDGCDRLCLTDGSVNYRYAVKYCCLNPHCVYSKKIVVIDQRTLESAVVGQSDPGRTGLCWVEVGDSGVAH